MLGSKQYYFVLCFFAFSVFWSFFWSFGFLFIRPSGFGLLDQPNINKVQKHFSGKIFIKNHYLGNRLNKIMFQKNFPHVQCSLTLALLKLITVQFSVDIYFHKSKISTTKLYFNADYCTSMQITLSIS